MELNPKQKKKLEGISMFLSDDKKETELAKFDVAQDISQSLSILKDAEIITIRGKKGETGEMGPEPTDERLAELIKPLIPDPLNGEDGKDGVDGVDGKNGTDGVNGVDGKDGTDGKNGVDGKDGSPDTGEQVIEKINEAEGLINRERVEGLTEEIKRVEGKIPTGYGGGSRGLQLYIASVKKGLASTINFIAGTGTSLTYSAASGRNDITVAVSNIGDTSISTAADILFDSKGITIDGGGSTITTGIKGYLEMPFNCVITRVTMLADASGSAVVDIWKDTYANYPPTVADTITASAKPTLSSATKSQDTTLTGWTTTIATGDILGFNVDSATTVKRLHVTLTLRKT